MAASARAIRAVVPHVPKIKFPERNKADFSFKFVPSAVTSKGQKPSVPSTPSNAPPIGLTPRGSGIDYTDLPLKYQRKPISQEEMEYIERGGPE